MGLGSFLSSAGGGSLLGGIATGLLGRSSAKQTNVETERLSSTAHQRATKDLRAAGLNPILSATGGAGSGASTPVLKDPIEHATKSATTGLAAARLEQELLNLKATARKTNAEAAVTEGNIPIANIKGGLMSDLEQDLKSKGMINANSAYAVGGAAGAYGAAKMFKGLKGKKTTIEHKSKKTEKSTKTKKSKGGGWNNSRLNRSGRTNRSNIFRKF